MYKKRLMVFAFFAFNLTTNHLEATKHHHKGYYVDNRPNNSFSRQQLLLQAKLQERSQTGWQHEIETQEELQALLLMAKHMGITSQPKNSNNKNNNTQKKSSITFRKVVNYATALTLMGITAYAFSNIPMVSADAEHHHELLTKFTAHAEPPALHHLSSEELGNLKAMLRVNKYSMQQKILNQIRRADMPPSDYNNFREQCDCIDADTKKILEKQGINTENLGDFFQDTTPPFTNTPSQGLLDKQQATKTLDNLSVDKPQQSGDNSVGFYDELEKVIKNHVQEYTESIIRTDEATTLIISDDFQEWIVQKVIGGKDTVDIGLFEAVVINAFEKSILQQIENTKADKSINISDEENQELLEVGMKQHLEKGNFVPDIPAKLFHRAKHILHKYDIPFTDKTTIEFAADMLSQTHKQLKEIMGTAYQRWLNASDDQIDLDLQRIQDNFRRESTRQASDKPEVQQPIPLTQEMRDSFTAYKQQSLYDKFGSKDFPFLTQSEYDILSAAWERIDEGLIKDLNRNGYAITMEEIAATAPRVKIIRNKEEAIQFVDQLDHYRDLKLHPDHQTDDDRRFLEIFVQENGLNNITDELLFGNRELSMQIASATLDKVIARFKEAGIRINVAAPSARESVDALQHSLVDSGAGVGASTNDATSQACPHPHYSNPILIKHDEREFIPAGWYGHCASDTGIQRMREQKRSDEREASNEEALRHAFPF